MGRDKNRLKIEMLKVRQKEGRTTSVEKESIKYGNKRGVKKERNYISSPILKMFLRKIIFKKFEIHKFKKKNFMEFYFYLFKF